MRGLSTRTAVRVTGVFGDFDGFLHACTAAAALYVYFGIGTWENVLTLGKETVCEWWIIPQSMSWSRRRQLLLLYVCTAVRKALRWSSCRQGVAAAYVLRMVGV